MEEEEEVGMMMMMGLLGRFCCEDCVMSGVGRGFSNCWLDLVEE